MEDIKEADHYKWCIKMIEEGSLDIVDDAMTSALLLGNENWRREIEEAAKIGWIRNYEKKLENRKGVYSFDWYLKEIKKGDFYGVQYSNYNAIHLAVRVDRVEELLEAMKIGFPHFHICAKSAFASALLEVTPNEIRKIEKKLFLEDVSRFIDSNLRNCKRWCPELFKDE